MGTDLVVLLLIGELEVGDEEASFIRELNSRDNSSAVAIDALRSSLMDWNSILLPKLVGELIASG